MAEIEIKHARFSASGYTERGKLLAENARLVALLDAQPLANPTDSSGCISEPGVLQTAWLYPASTSE